MDDYDYDSMLADCYLEDIPTLGYNSPRTGNEKMEKKFSVMRPGNMDYKTYEEAELQAKKNVAKTHNDYVIVQAIAMANTPTPDVAVTKL